MDNDNYNYGVIPAVDSLRGAFAASPGDWSIQRHEAWIYGIVIGWDEESLAELRDLHHWSIEDTRRLSMLHTQFESLRLP